MDDTFDPEATAATPVNQMERFQAMAQPVSQPAQQAALPNQQEQSPAPQAGAQVPQDSGQAPPMMTQMPAPLPEPQNRQLKNKVVEKYHPAIKLLAHHYDKLKDKGHSTPQDQVQDHIDMLKSLPPNTPSTHLEQTMRNLHSHLHMVVHAMRGRINNGK